MNIKTLSRDQMVDIIVYQYGVYKGTEKELRNIKSKIKNAHEPQYDQYCAMFPMEHGIDVDFYRDQGMMEQLSEISELLIHTKIKQEKFYKKLLHICSEVHGDDVAASALEKIDNIRKMNVAMDLRHQKDKKALRSAYAGLIEILNAVATRSKYSLVRTNASNTVLLNKINRRIVSIRCNSHGNMTVRKAAKAYYDMLSDADKTQILALSKEVLELLKVHNEQPQLIHDMDQNIGRIVESQ